MHMIINNSSMVPIYEQIVEQIKAAILSGTLLPDVMLPSVRSLSRELKISALTVKKAYDNLEEQGFVVTVHGKGTFVSAVGQELRREVETQKLEQELEQVIRHAKGMGITRKELTDLFEMLSEDVQLF